MPYQIPPFPKISVGNGSFRFPGSLSSKGATPLEEIHKRLRASVSNRPDEVERLVCYAVQQCYDMLKGIYARRDALNEYTLEEVLPEKAFQLALECGWLPEAARSDSPAWRDWAIDLLAGRFSRVGLEDSCKADPYLFVPFPVAANSGKAPVVTARPGGEKRTKPGPKRNVETARKVALIVEQIAKGEPWKGALDAICNELDDAQLPCPRTWRKRKPPIVDWVDAAVSERELATKAIEHHLKNAVHH